MMKDEIEYVDGEYGSVFKEKNSRQIKTRQSSFKSISSNFEQARLRKLNKDLEKAKKKALTDNYKTNSDSHLTAKAQKDIDKKAKAIARLEEKIKILSKEDVPSNYVENRAIKIRNAMMNNIHYNTRNAYSIGLDKENEVFEDSTLEPKEVDNNNESFDNATDLDTNADAFKNIMQASQEEIARNVTNMMNDNNSESSMSDIPVRDDIQVVPTSIERDEIRNIIDTEFEKAKNKEASDGTIISAEEVKNTVAGVFDDIEREANATKVSPEEVASTVAPVSDVNNGYSLSEQNSDNIDDVNINFDDIKKEIEKALSRVSKNEASSAKLNNFDRNGNPRKKYEYTPMTDEEIKQAQENIEYEKYEQIYHDNNMNIGQNVLFNIPNISFNDVFNPVDNSVIVNDAFTTQEKQDVPVRDFPVIVPERSSSNLYENEIHKPLLESTTGVELNKPFMEETFADKDVYKDDRVEEFTFANNDEQDLAFDFSEATSKDISNVMNSTDSLAVFNALRERANTLRAQQLESIRKRDEAIKAAEEADAKALQVKKMFSASQQGYEERLNKLKEFTDALESDCVKNETIAKTAEENIQCNQRFIDENTRRINDYNAMIKEIDSIITLDSVDGNLAIKR